MGVFQPRPIKSTLASSWQLSTSSSWGPLYTVYSRRRLQGAADAQSQTYSHMASKEGRLSGASSPGHFQGVLAALEAQFYPFPVAAPDRAKTLQGKRRPPFQWLQWLTATPSIIGP